MKKTLLFGAGAGAFSFISNEKEQRKILACIDNDEKKCGNKINGVSIILPKDIKNYDYDEIVITTQWATTVQKQLVDELKISNKKVIIPKKELLKKQRPFEDEKTREFARKIIKTFQKEAIIQQIPLLIDFGTLLGLVRDNDVILWDDDIDFSLNTSVNSKIVEKLINKVLNILDEDIKWEIYKQTNTNNQVMFFQIKFVSSKYISFIISIDFREIKNNKANHLPSLGKWFAPSKHFEAYDLLTWDKNLIQVPKFYKDYLTFLYGNWQVPKKDITMEDYKNLGDVSFDEVKQAYLKVEKIKG